MWWEVSPLNGIILLPADRFHNDSIAGLLAAQVCSRHFEHVIIVEPEAWLVTEDAKRVDGYNQRATRCVF